MTTPSQSPATIRTMSAAAIEARLKYQRPTPEHVEKMNQLNEKILALGRDIGELCPEGVMKSRAVTDLVLLRMVVNAAVIGDGIPAGSLAKDDGRPAQPSPDHVWDSFAGRWTQPGAKGPAISNAPVGA